MKVLVVGSGGREHTLCWKLKTQNPAVELFAAPGNPGTAKLGKNIPIKADSQEGILALRDFAVAEGIGLTVVGPEMPLTLGLANRFAERDLKVFGPTKEAAQIEASKAFAKELMIDQGIPTAEPYAFVTSSDELLGWLDTHRNRFPVAIKASGLAYGKGVRVCQTFEEAQEFADILFTERRFGDAADLVIVEECLRGPELSLLGFADGERVVAMLPARDYKPIFDGNRGPNTGGMGSYAPVPEISEADVRHIKERILLPAIRGLSSQGHLYKGVLYAGLMLTEQGPKVLEFNCRFGDPEAQPILTLLESNLLKLMGDCVEGKLSDEPLKWRKGSAVCVVAASPGYPGSYKKGYPISGVNGFEGRKDIVIFQAGTALDGGKLVTAGGRVLGVTGYGETLRDARDLAYQGLEKISFEGMYYRSDIALEKADV